MTNDKTTAVEVKSAVKLTTVDELMRLAEIAFKAGVCPQAVGRPETAFMVMMMGLEVGLRPAYALQNIMIVTAKKGGARMAMWGDALLALVRASGQLKMIDERMEGRDDSRKAVCTIQREGESQRVFTYSVEDAKRAGLWGNPGPWTTNPDRQQTMRARSFALRDVFTDVLGGLTSREEAEDEIATATTQSPPSADVKVEVVPAAMIAELGGPKQVDTPPAPPVMADGELMVTDETLRLIAAEREPFISRTSGIKPDDKAAYAAEWGKTLSRYGVTSAKQLTEAQAKQLHAEMTPSNAPETEEMRRFF